MDIRFIITIAFLIIVLNNKSFSYGHIPNIYEPNSPEIIKTVGGNINLHCKAENSIVWKIPENINLGMVNISHTFSNTSSKEKPHGLNLEIKNVTIEYVGYYICVCEKYVNKTDNHSKSIYLYVEDKKRLLVPSKNVITPRNNTTVLIPCRPTAPNVNISITKGNTWINLSNKIYDRRKGLTLPIRSTDDNFSCNCTGQLNGKSQYIIFNIYVKEKPSIELLNQNKFNHFYSKGQMTNFTCIAKGYPLPNIKWYFKNCIDINTCNFKSSEKYNKSDYTSIENENSIQSILNTTVEVSGHVMCSAENDAGINNTLTPLYISEIENGFDIIGDKNIVITGYNTTLICVISKFHNFSDTISWFKMPENIRLGYNSDGYELHTVNNELSKKLYLYIPKINKSHDGDYKCATENNNKTELNKTFTLNVRSIESPDIISSNLNNSYISYFTGEQNVTLFCEVKGYPIPIVTWYKNEEEQLFNNVDDDRMNLSDDGSKLHFKYIKPEDVGKYTCLAKNTEGKISRNIDLKLKEHSSSTFIILMIGLIFICILIVIIVLLILKRNRDKKRVKYLSSFGIQHFEEGVVSSINPDLGIDEQAEFLPYDKKWEFPRENLRLGKQLGSGAFGVVIKGAAKGIMEDEVTTDVAVKTIKTTADPIFMKSLVSELKILIHLGQHVNVVNLLGACTMNIVNREFFVIVEYCRYGNLNNYLRRRRSIFIDQLNHDSDEIDYKIGYDQLSNKKSIDSENRVNVNTNGNYIDMKDLRNGLTNRPLTITSSAQPEWRFNFRADCNYKEDTKSVSTKDLVCWSLQIVFGLEFLASRKIIHGDLATRNILLSDNNIVKICDFGLAKRMYKSYYKKKSEGPLPIKWMAIESIRDRVFSTQSDIWAYGIVLWELFSLACSPYPEMEANETFFKKIFEGYRMEKPQYANDKIYKIMLECWRSNPMQRPTFANLIERIGNMLDKTTLDHFIDLNKPYILKNKKILADHDYLAVMSSPDYGNYCCMSAKQEYVNGPNGGSYVVNPLSPEDIDANDECPVTHRRDVLNVRDRPIPPIGLSNPTYDIERFSTEVAAGNENIPMVNRGESASNTESNNILDDNGYVYPKPIEIKSYNA